MGLIATLAGVKERLGLTVADYDAMITTILNGLTAMFETRCHRPLILTASDVTETYSGQGDLLQLNYYPVVAVTSLKIAYDYDFTAATALVADTDYRLVKGGEKGFLYRLYGDWPTQIDTIQAIYRGGYVSADATPGSGETALPNDLTEAAIEQASLIFKRRDDIGLSAVGFGGDSINKFAAMKLLPQVKMILARYERKTL